MGEQTVNLLAAGDGGTNNFLVPNGTFFVELFIFLIVLGVIRVFVVPPVMKALRDRDAMIRQTVDDDKDSNGVFAAARADYKAAMGKARTEALGIRDETRAEGRKILEEMRTRASDEATQGLQGAAEQLEQQADATADNVRASVERMSKTLARRILGADSAPSIRSATAGGQGTAEKTGTTTAPGP
ncbi:MAG: F0F1 ATP synthase subunit B [Mycobacterium sp.]|nr:F0F1 ATP synthase subunit B [Mycobacterium sp.]